jgi:hypothetical protein
MDSETARMKVGIALLHSGRREAEVSRLMAQGGRAVSIALLNAGYRDPELTHLIMLTKSAPAPSAASLSDRQALTKVAQAPRGSECAGQK